MKTIDYIEFWATKHCNLNCKGCSSCSPIAAEWYLNPEKLEKDLYRLKVLDINVNTIGILGGEPLLHPRLINIFSVVKDIYPNSNLRLLTNGLLLSKMNDVFWETCRKYQVQINVTCFPVLSEKEITKIELLFYKYELKYHLTRKIQFNKILVEDNESCFEDIISSCGCNHAYNLYDGHLSRCTIPMVVELFNSHFQAHLVDGGKINIYESSADEIIDFLSKPNESCLNCSARPIKVEWEKAGNVPQKSDWIIGEDDGV